MTKPRSCHEIEVDERIDRLCDEFENRWHSTEPIPLEAMLDSIEESARPRLFTELLKVERELRERSGRPLSVEELRSRFEPLGSWVTELIEPQSEVTQQWDGNTPSMMLSQTTEEFHATRPILPESVGGYEVIGSLGVGGMGAVYRAFDMLGGREVAIKVMKSEYAQKPLASERFMREARSAMKVESDYVVPTYQVGIDDDQPFIVMPVLKGESLRSRFDRRAEFPLKLTLFVALSIAKGLRDAHAQGIVHRDMTPGNAWLGGEPDAAVWQDQVERVKILDFGLARAVDGDDGLTATGHAAGTPGYMAPEQANGDDVDGRADQFSLGAILYRMVTGQAAFPGKTISAILKSVALDQPAAPIDVQPNVPRELSIIIMKLLSKEPDKRYASMDKLIGDLQRVEDGNEVEAVIEPTRSKPKLHRWAIIGAALALLLYIGVWFASNGSPLIRKVEVATSVPVVIETALTIEPIVVQHFENLGNREGEYRGRIGDGVASARWNDAIEVEVRLSEPGYFYLIGCNFDGRVQLLYPENSTTASEKRERLHFPGGDEQFHLNDDALGGMQAFVVVASRDRLPNWDEFHAKPQWQRLEPKPGVWMSDGTDTVVVDSKADTNRGSVKNISGKPPLTALCQSLQRNNVHAVKAIAFPVYPRSLGK